MNVSSEGETQPLQARFDAVTLVSAEPLPLKEVAVTMPFNDQLPVVETLFPMTRSAPWPVNGVSANTQQMPNIPTTLEIFFSFISGLLC
jgi:hypothetical protein